MRREEACATMEAMGSWRTLIVAIAWSGHAAGCGRSPVDRFGIDGAGSEGGPVVRCGDDLEHVFAQVVVGYEPTAGGGDVPLRDDVVDPAAALGPPDHMPEPPLGTVSIGDGGTLEVGFEPCVMATDLGPEPDVLVHEAGFDEQVTVELRPTPRARVELGPRVEADGWVRLDHRSEGETAIDVDGALPGISAAGLRFDAVRIRDVQGQGLETLETPGADIDAVEIAVPASED